MKVIEFKGTDLMDDLRALRTDLSGSFSEELGFSSFQLNDDIGRGLINVYKVSDELYGLKVNVSFYQDTLIEMQNRYKSLIDFIYCLEGSVEQSFSKDRGYFKVGFRQNCLIKRQKNKSNFLRIPASTNLKMSYLLFSSSDERASDKEQPSVLWARTKDLGKFIEAKNGYRYLGRVCFRTAEYVRVMMNKSVDNITDILYIEAAILNIMASQIGRYQADTKGEYANSPIRPSEIDKIFALQAFINDNISENLQIDRLSRLSGLNASKLQMGFKYLYDNNVASYITQKRVETAAQLMESKEMTISEIVYAVGFSSRSYFSKIFKNHFGIKPSHYTRMKVKSSIAPN